MFDAIADAIGDAVVVAGADSRVLSWNAGAEATFGWSREQAIGRELTDLMPERYREAHLSGIRRLAEGGPPRLIGQGPVEIEALRATGEELPVELTLSRSEGPDGEPRFVAVIRDISERRHAERHREAQLAVARVLASEPDSRAAVPAVLAALGEAMSWQLGAMWLMTPDGGALRCGHVWNEPEVGIEHFEQVSRRLRFARGQGLPGTVWERRRRVWLHDVTQSDNFPRLEAARQAGLHGAVGLPVISDGEVTGVLEFFGRALREPDPAIDAVLEAVADQLGQHFSRKRAEDALVVAEQEIEQRRFAERQVADINDHIIHWLVQVTQALDAGDQRAAARAAHQALEHAGRMITDLQALPRPGNRDRN